MLRVGLDAAPPWHSANGVCEDMALSLLRALPPSVLPSPSLFLPLCAGWLIKIHYCWVFFPSAASSWGLVKQRTTQNTPQLQLSSKNSPVFFLSRSLSLSFFFFVKCATTGLSIDWNKNNQAARADQQSWPLWKPYRKAWKIRLAHRSLKWKPVEHKHTRTHEHLHLKDKYTLHCCTALSTSGHGAAYCIQRCLKRSLSTQQWWI